MLATSDVQAYAWSFQQYLSQANYLGNIFINFDLDF